MGHLKIGCCSFAKGKGRLENKMVRWVERGHLTRIKNLKRLEEIRSDRGSGITIASGEARVFGALQMKRVRRVGD